MIVLVTNLACMLLCAAVLVQSMRLMRSLRAVKDGNLGQVVQALDGATIHARGVLADLKAVLTRDIATNARMLDDAKLIRDELSVMIGIGDAIAERIANASAARAEATVAEVTVARAEAPADDEAMVD